MIFFSPSHDEVSVKVMEKEGRKENDRFLGVEFSSVA